MVLSDSNKTLKYLVAFMLIALSGYFLLAQHDDMNKLIANYLNSHFGLSIPATPQDFKNIPSALLDIPSLLFILFGWFVAEKLLDSNKPEVINDSKEQYLALKQADTDLEVMLDQIKSKDPQKMNVVYQKLHDAFNPYLVALAEHKRQGRIAEDFEFEVIGRTRNAIHAIEERIQHLSFVASVLPMLGMVGTLVGLMVMAFQFTHKTGGAMNAQAINANFGAVGLALLTTLYAAIFTIIFVKPRIQSLKNSLAKLINQSESVTQNGLYLSDLTEDYFLSAESEDIRLQWLEQAYAPVKTVAEASNSILEQEELANREAVNG